MRRETRPAPDEAGFTLVEVVLATALFAAIAFAALAGLRGLEQAIARIAAAQTARAALARAAELLRADALAAAAVWKPAAACGDALAFLIRDAGGTSFRLYQRSGDALVRVASQRPLEPCDPGLAREALVAPVAGLQVATVPAGALAAHRDPVSGNGDGAMLIAGGITTVAADTHVRDADGAPVRGGNTVLEVTIDAAPAVAVVDLVAGNRPAGFTLALTYACAARCAANRPFAELRGVAVDGCSVELDFAGTPAYVVPATFGTRDRGGGRSELRVRSYTVTGAYRFHFGGPANVVAIRPWPAALWPPGGAAVDDPYPVDPNANAAVARGANLIAADIGAEAAFAPELAACAALAAEPLLHG